MKIKENYLKKKIIFRCSHSGTKETDILYKKLIIDKINTFKYDELIILLELIKEYSDIDKMQFYPYGYQVIFSIFLVQEWMI